MRLNRPLSPLYRKPSSPNVSHRRLTGHPEYQARRLHRGCRWVRHVPVEPLVEQ